MQKTDFDIRPDKKQIRLGDRTLSRVEDAALDVMEDPKTGERILMRHYKELPPPQIDFIRKAAVRHFFPKLEEAQYDQDTGDLESQILDRIRGRRELKGILYPYCYTVKPDGGAYEEVYTVNELPEQFVEKYRRIDEAVQMPEFPLRARVLAALNLSDTMVGIQEELGGLLYSMSPEAVYINIESGEVRILIERCLDPAFRGKGRYEYGFATLKNKEPEGDYLGEADLLNFLEYATFRLLCMEDPFNGEETLLLYPCLTKKALEEIHQGDYRFIFSGGDHSQAAHLGPNIRGRWNSLPGSLRRTFERVFDRGGSVREGQMNLAGWRKQMRKLRDCLVSVNRQFRLCDPELSNKVLFMVIGEYQIPVWSMKAIYWYHVGRSYDAKTNGLVGGINAGGYLENRTDSRWVFKIDKTTSTVKPGEQVKLEEGAELTIENQTIRVVNGEKALPYPLTTVLDQDLTVLDQDLTVPDDSQEDET